MNTIDPESPPKPCEHFDMIGGTGIGGLIAIMLGRLQMTVDDCISAYISLSDKVFKKSHRGKLQGRFDTAELEQAVKQILVARGFDKEALLRDSPDTLCKVFVCATSKHTTDTVCLTSYRSPRGGVHLLDSTKIWQACRATSATMSFFDPIAIGPFGEEFVDGALGANNPVYTLWIQAQDIWGDQLPGKLRCLVSIGTGVHNETEKTAEQFRRDKSNLGDEGRYYRFNVNHGLEGIGLEEWEKNMSIASATRLYIASRVVLKMMKACANNLAGRECKSSSPLVDYEQRSVETTISLKAIEVRSENAANLFRLWAFLDNKDLWHGLLQAAADDREKWPRWLREVACNEGKFLDAVRLLLRYSMIEESIQGSYTIHLVVHR